MNANDTYFMQYALRLASRQLGRTAPNPAVGCVIVSATGQIVGVGATASGGRPHAETQALHMAGNRARGARMYVSLEPCSHQGKTLPCTTAIIDAEIHEVFVACTDPDPRVSGNGIQALRNGGLTVHTGLCEAQALALNAGFFSRIERQRPQVSLKLATSLDGCIATKSGESQWITGSEARRHGHGLRAQHDAILTGINTALADDPQLTCRISGLEHHSPIRILLDSHLRLPPDSQLAQSAKETPLWVITRDAPADHPLITAGATLIPCPSDDHGQQLPALLSLLAERGITRLLVEAGATLSTAFIEQQLVDTLYWYRAPLLIGDGIRALNLPSQPLAALSRYAAPTRISLGEDALEVYSLRTNGS